MIFLMQVLSLMPPKVGAALASVAVIVSFSGLDVVGTVLRVPGCDRALGRHEALGMVGGPLSIFIHDHTAFLGADSRARRDGSESGSSVANGARTRWTCSCP